MDDTHVYCSALILNKQTKSGRILPCFHARMFPEADYLHIDDLQLEAVRLIFTLSGSRFRIDTLL